MFSFFAALAVEAKALCIPGKHATPELHYQPSPVYRKKRSTLLQVRASLSFPLNATEMGEFQLMLRTHHSQRIET